MSLATETLHFLTNSIQNPKDKPHLRDQLQESLVRAKGIDLAVAERAVTAFFSGPRAV